MRDEARLTAGLEAASQYLVVHQGDVPSAERACVDTILQDSEFSSLDGKEYNDGIDPRYADVIMGVLYIHKTPIDPAWSFDAEPQEDRPQDVGVTAAAPTIEGAIDPADIPSCAADAAHINGYRDPVLLYTIGEIEIWGDELQKLTFPLENVPIRTIVVKNTGINDLRVHMEEPTASGSAAMYFPTGSGTTTIFPQPTYLYLAGGEEARALVVADYGFDARETDTDAATAELLLTTSVTIEKLASPGVYSVLAKETMALKSEITLLSEDIMRRGNSKIAGYVVDEATGAPMSDVPVTLWTAYAQQQEVRTDQSGWFCFDVYAYKQAYSGMWTTYSLTANILSEDYGANSPMPPVDGYGQARMVVPAVEGETVGVTVKLPAQAQSLSYTRTSEMDIDVAAYSFFASDDGNTIAYISFHSELPEADRRQRSRLTVTDKEGKLLFTKMLPDETPAVDVTPDGQLIATVLDAGGADGSVPVVYDREGNEVYRVEDLPQAESKWMETGRHAGYQIREVRLSDDGRYFAAADANMGEFWLIDRETDRIVWSTFLFGQIRSIRFDENDSLLYLSSGDGYIYCYTIGGELVWKSYVGTWATDMEVSEHYIAATIKASGFSLSLIDKKTGKNIWYYPAGFRGSGVRISPDETMIWWGNDIAGGKSSADNLVIGIDGRPLYDLGSGGAQMAGFTADSKYLAVKNGTSAGVFDRNGQLVWIEKIVTNEGENMSAINFTLYISPDGKFLVTAMNNDSSFRGLGKLYFYKRD